MQFRRPFGLGVLGLGLSLALAQSAFAFNGVPVCPAYGKPLEINNQQVLHWKRTTQNQFRERGNIKGTITRIFDERKTHAHFEIAIGRYEDDVVEVIYNQDFGRLQSASLKPGMTVQACGDFIVATAPSGPYPASPSGAIIHWVHTNPSGRGHDPGFLVIDGVIYGQDTANAGPPPRFPGKRKGERRQDGGKVGHKLDAVVLELEDADALELSELAEAL